MQLLSIKDFSVSVNDRLLFDIDQIKIQTGDRIGLIGANASGKSTFLNMIYNSPNSKDGFMRSGRKIYRRKGEKPFRSGKEYTKED